MVPDSGTVPPTGIAVDQIRTAIAETHCGLLMNCRVPNYDRTINQRQPGFLNECVEKMTKQLVTQLDDLVREIEAGRIVYDGAAFETCIDDMKSDCAFAEITSQRPFGNTPLWACAKAFRGKTAIGQPCHLDADCVPEAACIQSPSCPGVCTARLAAGATCTKDKECPAGTFTCSQNVAGARVCQEITRSAPANEGASCGLAKGPLDARHVADCASGLYCRYAVEGTKCAQPLALDAQCKGLVDECAGDAICAAKYQELGTCKALTFVADGADCSREMAHACETARSICANGRNCVVFNLGAENTPCDLLRPCQYDLTCNTLPPPAMNGTCVVPKAGGSTCATYGECASQMCEAQKCTDRGGCF